MITETARPCWAAMALGVAIAAAGVAELAPALAQLPPRAWRAPDGTVLPFDSDGAVVRFLERAEIVRRSRFDEDGGLRGGGRDPGRIHTYRVRLREAEIEVDAVFRDVDEQASMMVFEDGSSEIHLRDNALFECAAYEISGLLGLNFVPPAIPHSMDSRQGSLQISVQGAITESERASRHLTDPASQRWHRQLATMNVFDALIGNTDRNRQNLLYDEYWRMWLVDHTRAFRRSTRMDLDRLQAIEKTLWQRLQRLPAEAVHEALGPWLTEGELTALLERRAKLVGHFEALIAERGEERVVYTY